MHQISKAGEGLTRRGFVRSAAVAAAAVGMAGLAGCQSAGAAEGEASGPASSDYVGIPRLAPYAEPRMASVEDAQADVKSVLVVVDYQVDFVDGSLGTNELAIGLQDAICDRIKQYQDNGDYVFYTMDTHPSENYALTREGGRVGVHCVPGTDGWEVYGKVREVLTPETAIMVKKGTYGSKHLPEALSVLKNNNLALGTIELAGVSTSVCVFHNAVILYNMFPECEIVMDKATTAAKDEDATAAALTQLEGWGVKVNW